MIVVFSLSTTTRLARPSWSMVDVLELKPEIFGNDLPAGQDRDILQHGLAPIAEARRLHGAALEAAANVIDDQRRKRLAFDILGHHQQRASGFYDFIEKRQQVLEDADFPIGDQDQRVLHHGLHLLRVGDEVRRKKTAVELHALDDVKRGFGRLGFFDGDHALAADLVHGVGDEFADRQIVVRGNGGHLRRFLAGLDRARQRFQGFDRAFGRPIEAALDVDRARSRHHVAHAIGENRMCQYGRGAGSVTNHVAGLLGRLAEHAGAEILLRILEIEFLGDGHAVVAHDRRAPLPLDQDRLRPRPERHANGIGQLRSAAQYLFTGGRAEQDLLVCHVNHAFERQRQTK